MCDVEHVPHMNILVFNFANIYSYKNYVCNSNSRQDLFWENYIKLIFHFANFIFIYIHRYIIETIIINFNL